tara:strand:- start:76 stop:243 length:168 start_codon:yes stop_codon:yes gene_type:complete
MSLGNIGWSAVLSTVNEENGQKKKNGREGVAGEVSLTQSPLALRKRRNIYESLLN